VLSKHNIQITFVSSLISYNYHPMLLSCTTPPHPICIVQAFIF